MNDYFFCFYLDITDYNEHKTLQYCKAPENTTKNENHLCRILRDPSSPFPKIIHKISEELHVSVT